MRRRTRTALVAAAVLLAACGRPLPPPEPAGPLPTVRFAVARLEVVERAPAEGATFLDRRRGRELAALAARLLRRHLVAAGGPGAVRVAVERARLVERKRPRPRGLGGPFGRAPVGELEAALTVRLSVLGEDGRERAFALVERALTRPLFAGTGVVGREAEARALARRLAAETVRALAARAEHDLAAWLGLSP